MVNSTWGKRGLIIALACCIVALVAAFGVSRAYGFYYAHSENASSSQNKGVYEVTCVLDETAQGGGVRSEVVFVPEGGTVQDLLNEDITSSNSQNGITAIHNYDYTSLADYLSGKNYTCTVYAAESQKPGTHTTHDGNGKEGTSTQLSRFDNVVVKVS